MSDEKPQKQMISIPSNEVPDLEGMPGRWAQERLLEQLQELNLTDEFKKLQPELLHLENYIKSWLLKRSSCPVEFTWKDLGKTFWPRWVRDGACVDRKGSCSFPTGMHCVPAASTTVHLLRWQCTERKMTVYKKSADSKPAEEGEKAEAVQKRQMGRRRKPASKTPDDVLHSRRITDAHSLFRKTADEVFTNRRRVTVPEFPDQQRRKKPRCDWYRVPYPITIDCFCTC